MMQTIIVSIILLYAIFLIYSGIQIHRSSDMSKKVSKNPMCCGPVMNEKAVYMCMSPSEYQCYCNQKCGWYACEKDLTDLTLSHYQEFQCLPHWGPVDTNKKA